MVKKVGKYEIGKTLGEGTFGKVKAAVNTETGEHVAIKVLDKEKIQKQNMGAQVKKEISIMKMVRHENIVFLKEVLASRTKIFIVLELVTGGELFDKIVAKGRFNDDEARFYFRQLVEAVQFCHDQDVCHRDLKPENLLLDDTGNLKISDFGLSNFYEGGAGEENSRAALLHTTCGTPNYVAPEVLEDKGYDGKMADTWSCGVILYVLLAGFLPFDEPTMSALFRKIQKAEFSYPSWFSQGVRGILDKILVASPDERLTLDMVLQDPWMLEGGDGPPPPGTGTGQSTAGGSAASKGLEVKPSQQQMNSAVGESEADYEDDGDATEPIRFNAFDVINLVNGSGLSSMFMTSDEKSAAAGSKSKKFFISPKDSGTILARIEEALASKECKLNVNSKGLTIKAVCQTPKGAIGLNVQVYVLNEGLHVVQLSRGKGDQIEYTKFSTSLMELISDLEG
jgi:5'-AMP-activated protein kinase catalytic alpha subunit